MVLSRFRDQGQRPILLLVSAICISLWAGSGAMASLMEGFQAVYRIPTGRPFLKQRAMAIFLVLIVSIPSLAASTLILLGSWTEASLIHVLGIGKNDVQLRAPIVVLGHIIRYAIGFATTVFVTGLLYYFGPKPPACRAAYIHKTAFAIYDGMAGRGISHNALVARHLAFWLVRPTGG